MLTQPDVVRWIARNHAFACILDRSLKELNLAGPNKGLLLTMTEADSVLEGFRKLGQNEVNAVAIVNSKSGRLMGNLFCVRSPDVLSKFTVYAPEMQPVAAAEVQPNAHDCARMQCVE